MKTDTIRFYCSSCKNGIEAANDDIGCRVKCPTCQSSVIVPPKSVETSQKSQLIRWDLITIGLLLGILMFISGTFALFSSFGHKFDVVELLLDLFFIIYGGALSCSGATVILSERNPTIASQDAVPVAPKWTRLFAVVCFVFSVLFGGTIIGILVGGAGAGYCMKVLENRTISTSRRIHGCIFITLVTSIISIVAGLIIWNEVGPLFHR